MAQHQGQGSAQGRQGDDSVRDGLIILVGIFAAIFIFWWSFHTEIAWLVQRVRLAEAWLLPFDPARQVAIRHWVASTPPEDVTLEQILRSGAVVGHYLSWLAVGVLSVLGAWLAWRSPEWPGRYDTVYTMASLARQESDLWPAIKPVLGKDLLHVPLDHPIQGMRQTPRAYGRKHRFVVPTVSLKKFPEGGEPISRSEVFDVVRARRILTLQLGPRWQGIDQLKPHEKALFAAFASQAAYASEAAQTLINELPDAYLAAVKARKPTLITSPRVDGLLKAHGESEVVKKVLRKHGYVRTVLMALLVEARKRGILPPNWFRWLKTVDRITWYALCDLGTENASAEAAGVRSHYNAERLIGHTDEPEVEAAIDGFRDYLQEYLSEEEEETDE